MALSGTLETFSLPDVLRLLASTKKTGLLTLNGDRGVGRVWVADGTITHAESDRSANGIDGVVFDLLRFGEGAFEFEPGVEGDENDTEPSDVEAAIAAAEALLEEWREIESVVPSLDVWVRLAPEVDDDVLVSPAQWRVLAHIGTGTSGHRIAERLEQGELDVCRELRDLIDGGLVELDDEAPAADDAPASDASRADAAKGEPFTPPAFAAKTIGSADWTPPEPLGPDAVTEDPWAADEAPDVADAVAEHTSFDESVWGESPAEDVVFEEPPVAEQPPVEEPVLGDPVVEEPAIDESAVEEPDADDADDFLTQLAHLSPKAAAAVEATAGDDAPAESESSDSIESPDFTSSLLPAQEDPMVPSSEATDAVEGEPAAEEKADDADGDEAVAEADAGADEHGDDLDQNLLLRFLSSAKQ